MKKPTWKERFLYWFDNKMSRGTISLIRILVVFTIIFVLVLSGLVILLGFQGESDASGVLWDGFSTVINAWMPSYEDGPAGYVIIMAVIAVGGLMFTSVLIGLVTSAIEERIMNLKKGNSQVLEEGHIIVLGFTPGEYTLLRQLVLASVDGANTIVIGADVDREEMEESIKDNIEKSDNVRFICRTVDIFDPKSIERLSVNTCKSIVVSPMDDASTTKVLLALSKLIDSSVSRKIRISAIVTKSSHRFPPTLASKHNVTTLQTNDILARIIAHSCTQTGLSMVFREIFDFEGSEFYIIPMAECKGLGFSEVIRRMDHGVPIGLYRNYEIIMNPDPEEVIQEKDQLVLFTETLHTAKLSDEVSLSTNEISESKAVPERDTRVLVFGCNESLKTVISELPENVREVRLVNYEKDDLSEIKETASGRGILLSDITVNTEDEKELLMAARYMEHVIILGSHDEDEETADMETIFLLLSLRDIRARYHLRFNITAEMQKEMNQALVDDAEKTDFIVASNMSSLFLGQLSKRPELIGIFREILANQGNEILLKRADRIGCMGEHTVRELREMIYRQGYIMMGYLKSGEAMVSDPPLDEKVKLEREDSLIVLGEN